MHYHVLCVCVYVCVCVIYIYIYIYIYISREYIMDHLEAGNKILVFAHHQEVLDTIEEAVAKVNIKEFS